MAFQDDPNWKLARTRQMLKKNINRVINIFHCFILFKASYNTCQQYISCDLLHFPGGKQDLRYVHTPCIHIAFEGSLGAHSV